MRCIALRKAPSWFNQDTKGLSKGFHRVKSLKWVRDKGFEAPAWIIFFKTWTFFCVGIVLKFSQYFYLWNYDYDLVKIKDYYLKKLNDHMDCITDSTAMSPDMWEEGTFEKFFVANISPKAYAVSPQWVYRWQSPAATSTADLLCHPSVTSAGSKNKIFPRYKRLFHSEVKFQTLRPSTYYLHRIPWVSDVLPIVLGHSASCHLCVPAPRVDWDPIFIFYSLNKWSLRMCLEAEAVARRRARVFLKQDPSRRSLLSDTAALNLPRGQALPESSWVFTGDGVFSYPSSQPGQPPCTLGSAGLKKQNKLREPLPPRLRPRTDFILRSD